MIDAVGVVVPAHDEEELLPNCLAGLNQAVATVMAERPGLRVRIVMAADACTDDTAAVARRAGARLVSVNFENVGLARSSGLCELLRPGAPVWDGQRPDQERMWLATTDADSVVPAHWLAAQLRYADAGWEAVVGTVSVADWTGHGDHTIREFTRRYGSWQDWHPHVHGANLGFTARAYAAVGGFPALRTGEDQALVAALQAGGHQVLRSAAVSVVTSARSRYRAPAGFGHDLATLNDDQGPLLGPRGGATNVREVRPGVHRRGGGDAAGAARRVGLPGTAAARPSAHPHHLAPGGAAAGRRLQRGLPGPARLRTVLQTQGDRRPRHLQQAGHGPGLPAADAGTGLRAVRRGRARPGRLRGVPAGHGPPGGGQPPAHRGRGADRRGAGPLRRQVRDAVVPLVLAGQPGGGGTPADQRRPGRLVPRRGPGPDGRGELGRLPGGHSRPGHRAGHVRGLPGRPGAGPGGRRRRPGGRADAQLPDPGAVDHPGRHGRAVRRRAGGVAALGRRRDRRPGRVRASRRGGGTRPAGRADRRACAVQGMSHAPLRRQWREEHCGVCGYPGERLAASPLPGRLSVPGATRAGATRAGAAAPGAGHVFSFFMK